ncbi:MAG: amidohydrolase [Candidatus Liptonbacteria bacterium RIFCSPLOWO2_01_FULL_53_13]|uniref:Amidohydrolase n=1 Tax=Candidatus Liptonbacteria bacterium RIFCSPLOWO2_01_FULL_53_13 TaxID=1798651 RepID=A0A1G2CME7_9BACT|nr:MAG: amidohydrolase [Candidatus Liptonbacteria bacterium RIFCSPLOWO2_01_FULL_53_13]
MLTIRGKLINHDSERYGEVSIDTDTGLIAKVGELSGTTPDIDAGENLVFPGFGDIHVHAREDASGTHTYKEDFRTASEAAVKGGVTFFAEMPNNPTPPIDDASYAEKEKLAAKSLVPVVLYGLINPGVKPLSRRVPYKFVIGKSFSHLIFNSFEEMEKTLSGYRGQSVSFHAEDMAILENSKNAPTHETRRPPKSEDKGVATAIDLIRKNGLEGKICHVSTREAMMQIREAKKDGVAISGEVTPHHLYFDESAFTDENHIWFQVNPPIRTREDRMAMIEALRNGDIDYLATDHAPHSIEEKQRGISGIPNLDTYGAFTTWLMAKCDFTPMDIARVCAYNPGLFVNQFLPARFGKGFGRIEAGYAGSLTIIDPNAPRTVRREDLKTKCGWSPFEGVEFPGRVMYTIIQGKITKISN